MGISRRWHLTVCAWNFVNSAGSDRYALVDGNQILEIEDFDTAEDDGEYTVQISQSATGSLNVTTLFVSGYGLLQSFPAKSLNAPVSQGHETDFWLLMTG